MADPLPENSRDSNGHFSERNASVSPFANIVLPRLETMAFDVLRQGARYSEVSQVVAGERLSKIVHDIVGEIAITGELQPSHAKGRENQTSREVGLMFGEIVGEFFKQGIRPTSQLLFALYNRFGELYQKLKDPNEFYVAAQADEIRGSIQTANWEPLFSQENSYAAIGSLLSHAALLSAQHGFWRCSCRLDLDSAISGSASESGEAFNVFGGWHFAEYAEPIDHWGESIVILASVERMWGREPRQIEYGEFAELIFDDQIRESLSGCRINYFPIKYGNVSIGGLFGVENCADGLSTEGRKNLLLASYSAGSAFARVARMNATSLDCKDPDSREF